MKRSWSSRRHALALLLPALLSGAAGCSALTAPTPAVAVGADALAKRIVITNRSRRPVFTFVVGRRAAALILWAPCVGAPGCGHVEPGGTRTEPYPGQEQGEAEQEAIVHWWHAVPDGHGGLRPDSIRSLIVPL